MIFVFMIFRGALSLKEMRWKEVKWLSAAYQGMDCIVFAGQISSLMRQSRRVFALGTRSGNSDETLCSSFTIAMCGCWDVGWSGGWVFGELVLPTVPKDETPKFTSFVIPKMLTRCSFPGG